MGTDVRLIGTGIDEARTWLERYEAASRASVPASELSRLNADPRATVPSSRLLRAAVRAALWAARRTDGLVDPTLHDAVVPAGYARSLAGVDPAPLDEALVQAPARRPATGSGRWRAVAVTDSAVPARPASRSTPAAPARAWPPTTLAQLDRRAIRVDCGGDVRVVGVAGGPTCSRIR